MKKIPSHTKPTGSRCNNNYELRCHYLHDHFNFLALCCSPYFGDSIHHAFLHTWYMRTSSENHEEKGYEHVLGCVAKSSCTKFCISYPTRSGCIDRRRPFTTRLSILHACYISVASTALHVLLPKVHVLTPF